jgi:tetratricopeptide (TPR) repeat protein
MRGRSIAIVLSFVLTLSRIAAAQEASELYQRALVQEHAEGNLAEAIALFKQAAQVAGRDRALAARALVHVGGSYEKLGRQPDAALAYAEVIRVYPDQRAEAAQAQQRLSALRRQARTTSEGAATGDAGELTSLMPLFERYCTRCHGGDSKAGGLDLVALPSQKAGANATEWETIVRRLQARRDPPFGAPHPDDETYRTVISRIQEALDTEYASDRPPNDAERADDSELAARIAILIWNGPPDAELMDHAQKGRLHEPAVLNRQVRRMLKDARSSALVDTFFAEWLLLDRVQGAQRDPARSVQLDPELLRAMDTETRLFLHSQLRDDRDAVEIWTANYTYVNDRLARHYGLPDVTGKEFRRIVWPDSTRAGILGQAGILTMLSSPARTSPTTRGKYVLERFLGISAPNPPANVPALPERPGSAGATMRERMRLHRVNPSCGNCHALFDPLGLALENFDATGRWRTLDAGAPIDSSGSFVDGTRFSGPAQLRAGLLRFRDAYYTSVTQQLLAYALNRKGRSGRVHDFEMPAVRKIVRDASKNGFSWSSLIAGIVESAPFQMKTIVP